MTDLGHPEPSTMVALFNEDLVVEILKHLWASHNSSWDVEFRPEAFRRFFARYSLISRVWTLPSQQYVYRNTSILWDHQYHSFERGVKNSVRGQALRETIRVLEISISNKRLGNPLNRLDKILRYCPRLVELRLRIGPEVNTLFIRSAQEKRLRESLLALRPSLRAFQLRIEAPWTKSQVMKQIPELIPYSTLDFLTIASHNNDVKLPELSPEEWDVRTVNYSKTLWPMETNAPTIPMTSVLYPDPESTTPLIGPETLRAYSDHFVSGYWSYDFLHLLGPRLKRVVGQLDCPADPIWTDNCDRIATVCPNLEQMVILDIHPSRKRDEFPCAHMYVLESQDWYTTEKAPNGDNAVEEEEKKDGEEESEPKPPPPPVERVLAIGEQMPTLSHVVTFRRDFSKSWRDNHRYVKFRNGRVFDPRWIPEAVTGLESTINAEDHLNRYRWTWSEELLDSHQVYMVALRQPSTVVEETE